MAEGSFGNPILDAARLTTRALEGLQQDNATMRVTIAALETRLDEYKQINQSLFEQANKASIERDYFMRECAILSTRLSDLSALAQTALDDHRHAPYRRNGGAPEDVQKAVAEANEQRMVDNNGTDKLADDSASNEENVASAEKLAKGDDGEPVPSFLVKPPLGGLTAAQADAVAQQEGQAALASAIDPVDRTEAQIQKADAHFGAPKNGRKNK